MKLFNIITIDFVLKCKPTYGLFIHELIFMLLLKSKSVNLNIKSTSKYFSEVISFFQNNVKFWSYHKFILYVVYWYLT